MNGLINALKKLSDESPLENFHKTMLKDQTLSCHYWAINDWGGIGAFKKNEKNDAKIKSFLDELEKRRLTRNSFECISSLSKVASFINPEKYAIYDSRAIYSLNWLLFNHTSTAELFPQPIGRNAKMSEYDMQTIFRLTKRSPCYKSHKDAYHQYCDLLNSLSIQVFGENSKPYNMEMLLFMVAPEEIVKQIESSVSLEIKTPQ